MTQDNSEHVMIDPGDWSKLLVHVDKRHIEFTVSVNPSSKTKVIVYWL